MRGSLATDGELCGTGPVSDALRSSYQELNSNFPALQSADDKTVSSLDSGITNLNSTISADRNRLSAQIHAGIAADLANTGLAAQSEALWTLLKQDVLLWLWPVFFIVIDLAVALMKGVLPGKRLRPESAPRPSAGRLAERCGKELADRPAGCLRHRWPAEKCCHGEGQGRRRARDRGHTVPADAIIK